MTRGIRNNNPGNIRHTGVVWLGQADLQDDPDFVVFKSAEYGIRAIVRIVRSYERLGINTVRGVISRWAPQQENDTSAYIQAVCSTCSVTPDQILNLDTILSLLLKAIIRQENGVQPYADLVISEGIALA